MKLIPFNATNLIPKIPAQGVKDESKIMGVGGTLGVREGNILFQKLMPKTDRQNNNNNTYYNNAD